MIRCSSFLSFVWFNKNSFYSTVLLIFLRIGGSDCAELVFIFSPSSSLLFISLSIHSFCLFESSSLSSSFSSSLLSSMSFWDKFSTIYWWFYEKCIDSEYSSSSSFSVICRKPDSFFSNAMFYSSKLFSDP